MDLESKVRWLTINVFILWLYVTVHSLHQYGFLG